MSDDLSKKISQITELLGQGEMPENLKGAAVIAGKLRTKAGGCGKTAGSSSGERRKTIRKMIWMRT